MPAAIVESRLHMPTIPIADSADPRLAIYRDLNKANLCRTSGRFIAEGAQIVDRMLAADVMVESLLVEECRLAEFESRVSPETPLFVASRKTIKEIIGYQFHRGALACGFRPAFQSMACAIPSSGRAALVVCPQIQDPENMGAILRTACVLGANAVLLGRRCADPYSRRVLRVAMGNTFRLSLVEMLDPPEDLRCLRDELGLTLVATVLDAGAEPLEGFAPPERFALLLGEEGHGLSQEIIALCDRRVTLAMARGADSLNVGVASGIFLYHLMHNRQAVGS
jgi:tRNA G18 (ribose-2'-O)-methylase SpoU